MPFLKSNLEENRQHLQTAPNITPSIPGTGGAHFGEHKTPCDRRAGRNYIFRLNFATKYCVSCFPFGFGIYWFQEIREL